MVAAGEAGKEEEPHCDVMEALPGCWGVVRANLVVWRDGAGQNCQRGASVEEERAGEKRGEVTRHSDGCLEKMKTEQTGKSRTSNKGAPHEEQRPGVGEQNGESKKKKNLSFPETDNQEGCKGTRGEGVSLRTEPGKGLGVRPRPESSPPPHCHNKQQRGQNGQANGRVSGKRVAVGGVVQAPQG